MNSGNLNFLEPSGPLQGCNGTSLPFLYDKTGSKCMLPCSVEIWRLSTPELKLHYSTYLQWQFQLSRLLIWSPEKYLVTSRSTSPEVPRYKVFSILKLFSAYSVPISPSERLSKTMSYLLPSLYLEYRKEASDKCKTDILHITDTCFSCLNIVIIRLYTES